MSRTQFKILHLANSLSDRGNGIINVATDLAIEQACTGNDVCFASKGGGFVPLLQEAGIRHIEAPQAGAAAIVSNSLRLLSILRQHKPQIIHTHMRNGLILVAPWARLLRIPLVMHLHNIHDRDYGISRIPERIIAVSTSVRESLIRRGASAHRISVVENGVLGTKRRMAHVEAAPLQKPAIVTVAGMMQRKGIADLIQAFDRLSHDHPTAHLYLVGGGSEQQHYEKLAAASAGSSRIHFEGFQIDPRPYLLAADVFVLASHRESFGLAILEAREAGCAIVGSDIDGIPELLEFGRCGILSAPEQPAELARNIDRLLRDPALQHDLRTRASHNLERFTVARMTEQVQNVYQDLVA